jgi:hypothetical protein
MKRWVSALLAMGLVVAIQAAFGVGSAPTDSVSVTPTWQPQLQGEKVGFDGTRWFYGPFGGDTDSPPPRYLTLTEQWMLPSGYWITYITHTDKKTGQQTTTTIADDVLSIEDLLDYFESYEGDWETFIDMFFDPGTFLYGPVDDGNGGALLKASALSDLYTPEEFVGNVEGWVPAFQNTVASGVDSAYLHLSDEKLTYSLQKLQYKWNMGDHTDSSVVWDEQFTPDDGGPVQHHVMSWAANGSAESPVFSIDPTNYPTVDNSTNPPQTVTKQNGTYQIGGVTVLVFKTDRDDPLKPWQMRKGLPLPVYSGTLNGDMVTWRLYGTDSWTDTTFAWSAEGPESISGPSGIGRSEWSIDDLDDDAAHDWVDWKPGTYSIKCEITPPGGASATVEFQQEIGWRTEEYAVIGQIVPTHAHDRDKPGDLGSAWQFRRAVAYDFRALFVSDAEREAAALLPIPTEKLSALWFTYWTFLRSRGQTPQGPFTSGSTTAFLFGQASRGTVLYGHRYWMVQSLFNMAPDQPPVDPGISFPKLKQIQNDGEYRIMHRYQTKFFLDDSANMRNQPITVGEHVAFHGKTKGGLGLEANELYPGSPAFGPVTFPLMSSETDKVWNRHEANTSSKVSGYALARVGPKGRNANWRLVGKDAPFVFSEIIHEVKPDRSVQTIHRTSLDITWGESSGQQGSLPFNNLNIYKSAVRKDENGLVGVNYTRINRLRMEGSLEPFVNSASGQWPEPSIPPSIR